MSKQSDEPLRESPTGKPFEQYGLGTASVDLQVRPVAVVTGASTGIGFELAKCCARGGFDLVVAADEPAINQAAATFRTLGSAWMRSKPILRRWKE